MSKVILGKINVDLTMGTAQFEAAVESTKKKTSELEKAFSNYGKSIAAGLGTGAIIAGFSSAISAANEFNSGLANVASLMPGNRAQVEAFGAAIQDLAIQSGKSTTDLTAGMYQVVSAFGGGADAVDRLRIATEASQAGLSTTTEAIDLLSVTTKAYGDTSTDAMQKASDLAFKTVQLGQTTFPELAKSLQNVASEASRVGVSQEELFASFAATTGVIGNASMVSTKMKAALEALSNPTDKMKVLLKELGVESGQALIKQQGLQGAFELITQTAEKSKMPLGQLIGSIEGQAFAASIAGQQSDKYKESIAGMADAAGTTKLALAEQKDGLNSVGAALDRLGSAGTVTLEKIGNAILGAFGQNTTAAIDGATKALQNFGKWLDEISGNNPIPEQIARLKQLKDEVAGGDLSLWDQWFGEDRKEQISRINEEIKKLQSLQRGLSAANSDVATSTEQVAKKEEKRVEGLKLQSEETSKATKAMQSLAEKYRDTLNDIEKNKVGDAFSAAIKNQDWREIDRLGEELYKTTKDGIISGLDDSIKSDKQALEIADAMARAISNDKVKQGYAEIEKYRVDKITESEQRLSEIREQLDKKRIEEQERAERAMTERQLDYMQMGQDAIIEGYKTGNWEKAGANLGLDVTRNVGNFFFPGAGDLQATQMQLYGEIYQDVFRNFGNEDTIARDKIESFLEDTLQTNVVFGEDIQSNWADAFGAIAGDGQTAFETLGTSIALLAGESSELGGQIGFILAQNLNGNLDMARLLVQSLGIDAEQMGAALMEAAKSGEMSWAQWAALQNEVNTLTADGLVAAGDLKGAWDQFLMTGGKGQISLTSLRNVAIEAGEAGVETLDELQSKMIELGYSQEEVDRLINQLQAQGITNMEELRNASDETLGRVIANLENAGQEWGNFNEDMQSAIDKMSELEKKLRGIEDREIDLTVNVKYKTSGDKVSSEVQEAALGGVFDNIQAFANGGIVTAPTYFSHSRGMGLMGEAGREAIIPLGDGNKIKVEGYGGAVNFNYSIDARGAGAGAEASIAQAIRMAHQAAVRDSVSAISEAMRRGAL